METVFLFRWVEGVEELGDGLLEWGEGHIRFAEGGRREGGREGGRGGREGGRGGEGREEGEEGRGEGGRGGRVAGVEIKSYSLWLLPKGLLSLGLDQPALPLSSSHEVEDGDNPLHKDLNLWSKTPDMATLAQFLAAW